MKSQVKGQHPKRSTACIPGDGLRCLAADGGRRHLLFLKHEDGKHTLVMADQKGVHRLREARWNIRRRGHPRSRPLPAGSIAEFRTGKWARMRLQFRGSSGPQRAHCQPDDENGPHGTARQHPEMQDYDCKAYAKSPKEANTKTRMEEEAERRVYAASTCRTFTPGGTKIRQHLRSRKRARSTP
jgi:uncharacterized protein involved in type VI secretion and phage assembly